MRRIGKDLKTIEFGLTVLWYVASGVFLFTDGAPIFVFITALMAGMRFENWIHTVVIPNRDNKK
jgi:hypothetical protein